jgi:hypothetical protein
MTRKQLNHQAALECIAAFLGLRAADLAVNPLIGQNAELLLSLLAAIRDYKQIQDKTTQGATRTKSEIEKAMVEGLILVGAGLCGYATEIKNYNLLALATFTDSDIKHLRGSDLADKVRTVVEAAEPVALHLGTHQVTTEDVATLKANQILYLGVINGPRGVIGQTKQSTSDIQVKLDEARLLVKENLDVFMRPFKVTNPTVYGEYKNASIIVDVAATHNTRGLVTVKAIDDATGEPIAGAEAKAKKKGQTELTKSVKRSEVDGVIPFRPLVPGAYDVEVFATGYAVGTGEFEAVAKERTEIVVRLVSE